MDDITQGSNSTSLNNVSHIHLPNNKTIKTDISNSKALKNGDTFTPFFGHYKSCSLDELIQVLRRGKAAVFPTDTVYGLGVSVKHAPSLDEIFELKHRPNNKAVAWLISTSKDLEKYGCAIPQYARLLINMFWPGPLTIVVKASSYVPLEFRGNNNTIALRFPQSKLVWNIIDALDSPLATSSANISGEAPAVDLNTINSSLIQNVDAVYTHNESLSGHSSSVVDCSGEIPTILRKGDISTERILESARS